MPIKQRFEGITEYVQPVDTDARVVDTFDPANDPYPGSTPDKFGIPREYARSILARGAYTVKPPLPSRVKTQDLLMQLRLANNPGDQTEQRYRNRITSPLTGIRAFCVECKGGSPKAAGLCDKMECPLWSFRLGQNSFYGRK